MSTPACNMCMAVVCRKVCGETRVARSSGRSGAGQLPSLVQSFFDARPGKVSSFAVRNRGVSWFETGLRHPFTQAFGHLSSATEPLAACVLCLSSWMLRRNPEFYVLLREVPHLRNTCPGVVEKIEEASGRDVQSMLKHRGLNDRGNLVKRQVSVVPTWKPFQGNCQHPLDNRKRCRIPCGREFHERYDRGKPNVACLCLVPPLLRRCCKERP